MPWLLLALSVPLSAAFPQAIGYVNDFARLLDDRARAEVEALLRDTERTTSAEIALVTVSSLDGMAIEEYANRLFHQWGVGKTVRNNGVLVVVAPAERQIRIEVGYGLEPILPDGLAGSIIRAEFLPAFKRGDYSTGVLNGIQRIADIVRKNETLSAEDRRALERGADDRPPAWLMIPFFGAFVSIGAFALGAGFRTRTGGPLLFGALFAGGPMLMATVEFFNVWFWLLPAMGLGMFLWGYRQGATTYWREALRGSTAAEGDPSGWVMGGSTGDSAGSGGSSGDFGGGSSGGGGASGRW